MAYSRRLPLLELMILSGWILILLIGLGACLSTNRTSATVRMSAGEASQESMVQAGATGATMSVSGECPRLGILIPKQGPFSVAGEQILAGAAAAAGIFTKDTLPCLTLLVGDAANAPTESQRLVKQEQAVALAALLPTEQIAPLKALSATLGVPMFFFSSVGNTTSSSTFEVLPDNGLRLQALANYADRAVLQRPAKQQKKVFAIFAPDNSFGHQAANGFSAQMQNRGWTLSASIFYPPQTTSFSTKIKELSRNSFSALFVPDSARQLSLIAPALTRAQLSPYAAKLAEKKPTVLPPLLLSTADGFSPTIYSSSGKYLWRTVVAPGFYPTAQDATSRSLLENYRRINQRTPSLLEAAAYDLAILLRTIWSQKLANAPLAVELIRTANRPPMFTGAWQFGPLGQRVDPPVLYIVEEKGPLRCSIDQQGLYLCP